MVHYELNTLLQNTTDIIIKCDGYFISKCDKIYYKMRQVVYYKINVLLQIAYLIRSS